MKKIAKRIAALALATALSVAFSTTAFAAKTSKKTKSTTEFGTLTGYQYYIGKNDIGRKEISFYTSISKLSSTSINTYLYAEVVIKNYKTGSTLGGDNATVTTNKTYTGYYWEGHSTQANNNAISSFGKHEARRSGSAVVYTTLTNLT